MIVSWAVCIAAAYLIGSIPFGLIIGRLRGVDIRLHGSQNIGATNVGRVLGKKWGLICFGLDCLKGAAPVAVAGAVNGTLGRWPEALTTDQLWLWLAVGLAAVLGHMFSIFLGFRGGKGVATGAGVMLGMWPLLTVPAVVALLVWVACVRVTRIISLSSMVAALAVPVGYAAWVLVVGVRTGTVSTAGWDAYLLHAAPPFWGTLVVALLIIRRHRTNIRRLMQGTEPKLP